MNIQKIMAAVLATVLALSLCACDQAEQPPQTQATQPTETAQGSEPAESAAAPAEPMIPEEYDALLTALTTAFPNVSSLAEYPGLSYMYDGHTSLTELGYAYADVDGDGTAELLIKSLESPFIYDAFTVIDGELVQLFSGGEHISYRLYEGGLIENQWSESASCKGTNYYRMEKGTLVLFDRVAMDVQHAYDQGLIDSLEEPDTVKCFFRGTSDKKEDYTSISSSEALSIQQSFVEDNAHLLPGFTPLSSYGQ